MLKFIVADDHAVVRQGIKQILSAKMENVTVVEAQSANEVMLLIQQRGWDLLILDIGMPGRSGLEVLNEIRSNTSPPPILVLSMYPEDQMAQRVLKAGADGYLTKDSAPEALVLAVRKILSGGKYVSSSFAERIVSNMQKGIPEQPHNALSNREYEVMRLIALGKTVSQVAQQLSLSVKTVSTYRARILNKMGMETNAELIHYAVRNGLMDERGYE
ncbi:MAG TPA: response regulator transcription factor [Chthonomonadaceae bacterium]|nr:response regulator transcription factor [Chthonomonadaceae bacterium]